MTTNQTITETIEQRYKKAIAEIEANGVRVFENYPSCCGSCASYELGMKDELKDKDYIFFINEQGNGLEWWGGIPMNFEMLLEETMDEANGIYEQKEVKDYSSPATQIFWNHSGNTAGRVTTEAFRNNGFTVDWDNTEARCPEVFLVDEKTSA